MNKYYELIENIDNTFLKYKKELEVIEKDYPNNQLTTIEYNTRKNRLGKIEEELNIKIQFLFSSLESLIKQMRKQQPHFDKDLTLQKRETFPEYFVFGRLRLSSDNIKSKNIPKLLPFPLEYSLYSYKEESLLHIYQYILRVLQISPLNKLEFLLIDPKTLGKSFNFIRPILDNNFIYNQRILTYADEIEESLLELADYMENLLQKQLSGVKDWKNYNRKNPSNILPLKILIINGFPEQFSANSLLYISRIVQFGSIAGINCFMIMENIKDENTTLKNFEEKILKYSHNIENLEYLNNENYTCIKLENSIEPMPNSENIKSFLKQINDAYKKESIIKGEIDSFWDKNLFIKKTAIDGISIPIGWDNNENEVNFEIGFSYSEHHTLIGGRSGSGKSNLVNVIIQNIAYFYSPDEVELFLLDYKDGVEFNSYTNPYLKHASLIAINSNVSYGVSFLKYILLEKDRRSDLFKQYGTKDYKEYREKSLKSLSRIIIIIDEFQTLFTTKEKMLVENMVAELLRKGRSFGIHIILSTQTLSGVDVGSISQLKSQIGNRIALTMGIEESYTFLSMNNEAASKLNGKPEAIYNNKAGNIDGNKKVFIPYASQRALNKLLNKISSLDYKKKEKIYDGEKLSSIDNINLKVENGFSLILGREQSFLENEFIVSFKKEHGSNLLISGKNKLEKQTIIDHILLNINNNSFIKNFFYINNDFDIDFSNESNIDIFQNKIPKNSIILIDSFDTLTELHPKQNMGFGSTFGAEPEIPLSDKFKDIVENGLRDDIYTIIFVDNYKRLSSLNEFFDLFNHRIAFNLNSNELNSFLKLDYNLNIQSISNKKGVYSNLLTSNTIEFKFFRGKND